MIGQRLTLALERDVLPATGPIAVVGAPGDADLSMLPQGRVTVIQDFRPDVDVLRSRGFTVLPEAEGRFAAAIVCIPRSRDAARAAVAVAAEVVEPGGPIWVDGQKHDGIDPLLKDLRVRAFVSEPIAKAHGRIFRFVSPGPTAFEDWGAKDLVPVPGFVTRPGVFSSDGPDPGSEALAAALPSDLPRRVADLGAGWGWLAAEILKRPGVAELHVVEASHLALECARRNLPDPRVRFHWADATTFQPPAKLDAVVMNPPFHKARAAEPQIGVAFIRAAARMLAPHGTMWMVANRHLPYEAVLSELFGECAEIAGSNAFKVIRAARPRVRTLAPRRARA